MPEEIQNVAAQNDQIIRQESGLAGLPVGGSPALSEIINRSLIHIQTNKVLAVRHRIGELQLCDPDYRLVCSWAEELRLTQEDVLERLMNYPYMRSTLVDGKFKELRVDQGFLEISGLPSISGLKIEFLEICDSGVDTEGAERPLKNLDLKIVPGLKGLSCSGNALTTLDLSLVPNLMYLNCWNNNLSELDFSFVPNLSNLNCSNNHLPNLDLSNSPNLRVLDCSNCSLVGLDLSAVPNLTHLNCSAYWSSGGRLDFKSWSRINKLQELDLRLTPNLIELDCSGNPLTSLDLSSVAKLVDLRCESNNLTTLDLSVVPNLEVLFCEENIFTGLDIRTLERLRVLAHGLSRFPIIQRPDQKFK